VPHPVRGGGAAEHKTLLLPCPACGDLVFLYQRDHTICCVSLRREILRTHLVTWLTCIKKDRFTKDIEKISETTNHKMVSP
jgi:hypothetical protein